MAEEMQNDNDFEQSQPKANKDIWLFFIFLDIIVLCVLGFFIYKSFLAGKVFAPAAPQQPALEEVLVEEPAKKSPEKEEPKPAEPAVKEPANEPAKEPAKEEAKEPAKPAAPAAKPAEPKRESVVISGTGKTRSVTFKYFGEAKTAAVIAGFTMRKPVAMKKANGVWQTTIIIYPGEYRYKYIIDGKEIADPNAQEDAGRSVLIVK